MQYHKATIQLKATGDTVRANGFVGLQTDLEQVEKAIHGLEKFLALKDQGDLGGWEKGTLIIPDNDQLKNASMRDKELWARHIDSNGKTPPPGIEINNSYCEERKLLAKARNIHGQMKRHMTIAQLLVNRQQTFLKSGNWMNKVKISYVEVAEHLPDWGEKTVRDSVHSLSFTFQGNVFPADTLVCASEMPSLCKQIHEVLEANPRAGAPLITKSLHAEGLNVSQRMVGTALQLISSHKSRQLA